MTNLLPVPVYLALSKLPLLKMLCRLRFDDDMLVVGVSNYSGSSAEQLPGAQHKRHHLEARTAANPSFQFTTENL